MRSCAAVLVASVLLVLLLPPTLAQVNHKDLDDLDVFEDQGLLDNLPFEQRASFIQWILALLGYSPSKPTVHPPPQPIDQSKCSPCKCGRTKKQERIVGGHVTYVNEYPWMCLLLYLGKFYCGCTLINSKYVMTASHCIHGFKHEKISVRCYEHDRETDNETQHLDRKVARIVGHSGYSEYSFNNDIALIALDKEMPIDDRLLPVCLPPPKKSFTGETGIVTGWGVKKAGGSTSATLQEVQVPIMSNKACKNSSYGSSRITENMMCAGYPEGKKDSCQGDSGGPMHVVLDDSIHHIAGIVSWGEGCAQADHPGVYTRVNRYLSWIQKNTRDACYCDPLGEGYTTSTTAPPTYPSTAAPSTSSTYPPPAPVTEVVHEKRP